MGYSQDIKKPLCTLLINCRGRKNLRSGEVSQLPPVTRQAEHHVTPDVMQQEGYYIT